MTRKGKILLTAVLVLCLAGAGLWSLGCRAWNEQAIGGDWHTWRGYTPGYELEPGRSVTMSFFAGDPEAGEGTGYAVYEASGGMRIGTILLDAEILSRLADPAAAEFVTGDPDGDGHTDLGIRLDDGSVAWYRMTPEDAPGFPHFPKLEQNP